MKLFGESEDYFHADSPLGSHQVGGEGAATGIVPGRVDFTSENREELNVVRQNHAEPIQGFVCV